MSEYTRVIAQSIRQIVDNDETVINAVNEAVIDRIRTGSGYAGGTTADDYRDLLDRGEVTDNILDVVRDTIVDHVEQDIESGFAHTLLLDLMDLGDRAIWTDIADAYVPTLDDYTAAID